MGSTKPRRWALLAGGLVVCVAAAAAAASSSQRQRAMAAYEKAERMHATLEARSQGSRTKDEFKRVIDAYYDVYRQDPAYGKSPVALTAIAELYQEMGHVFSSDSYFLEAIKSYQFLGEQYPQARISREALFTIGDVYLTELEDPDEARKAFQAFVTTFPNSDEAVKARQRLKEIDRRLAARSRASATPLPAPHRASSPPVAVSAPVAQAQENVSGGVRQVTAVRRWVGSNYLRIVIGVDGDTKFESVRLSNPDRIVVDLQNARLSPELGARIFPIENGYLRQIRVAQFTPEVSRVVLDVEKIDDYSIFSLPNPFRLVIDVQGVPPTQLAKASKPTAPAIGARNVEKSVPASAAAIASPRIQTLANAPATTPSSVKTESVAETSTAMAVNAPAVAANAPVTGKPAKSSRQEAAVSEDIVPPTQSGVPTESGSRTLTRALGLKVGRIVIDPGHGGHDTGTIGPTGLEEKNVVLDVALKLRKLLENNTGCEVVMTRSDDSFIPLEERTAIANEKAADLFISIHANASTDETARGIETYYLNFTSSPEALEVAARENASSQEAVHQLQDLIKKIAMTEKIEESQDFARQVQREVYTRVTKVSGAQQDRGIKKAPFVVLIGANMPSILAEISFLTNPRDERLLRRSDYREKIANALFGGIQGYLKTLGEVRTAQRVDSDQSSSTTRPDF